MYHIYEMKIVVLIWECLIDTFLLIKEVMNLIKQFYKQIGFKLEKIYLVMSINQGYLEELTFQKYIGVLDY